MIKSKERIANFGEVFTSTREVNAMLDLVHDETARIDSRFLEPACGDGNFLSVILERKLSLVTQKYHHSDIELMRYTFTAVSSLYGIDILSDNVETCRQRLLEQVKKFCLSYIEKHPLSAPFLSSIETVLQRNIIHGDALSLTHPETKEPIVFSEWCFTTGSNVKRTDYTMNNLLAYQPFESDSLFSDLGTEVLLPIPSQSFKVVNFLELSHD